MKNDFMLNILNAEFAKLRLSGADSPKTDPPKNLADTLAKIAQVCLANPSSSLVIDSPSRSIYLHGRPSNWVKISFDGNLTEVEAPLTPPKISPSGSSMFRVFSRFSEMIQLFSAVDSRYAEALSEFDLSSHDGEVRALGKMLRRASDFHRPQNFGLAITAREVLLLDLGVSTFGWQKMDSLYIGVVRSRSKRIKHSCVGNALLRAGFKSGS